MSDGARCHYCHKVPCVCAEHQSDAAPAPEKIAIPTENVDRQRQYDISNLHFFGVSHTKGTPQIAGRGRNEL